MNRLLSCRHALLLSVPHERGDEPRQRKLSGCESGVPHERGDEP